MGEWVDFVAAAVGKAALAVLVMRGLFLLLKVAIGWLTVVSFQR